MFVRRVRNAKGVSYLQIVESYRDQKAVRQRVLFSLGRLEDLQATGQLDQLVAALSRYCERLTLIDLTKDVSVDETYVFGSVYVLDQLFRRGPLLPIVEEILGLHQQVEIPLVDTVFAMLVSRFVRPCSKRSLKKRWLERLYPGLVRSDLGLHQLYRTLDLLAEHKSEIQQHLIYPTSQLSLWASPKLELVFYDTTTLRFESVREDRGVLRRFGYSKERRVECTQVILGLLLDREGMPVGYELFPGNTYEGHTLPGLLRRLKDQYHIGRLIFVADRGMLRGANLDQIEESGFQFIMGMKLWSLSKKEQERMEHLTRWETISREFRLCEMTHPRGRLIVTWSQERADRDRQVRTDLLKTLRSKVAKNPEPTHLLSHKGFKRYLKVLEKGRVAVNERTVAQETRRDGLFGIITNVPKEEMPALEILQRYKELWRIEDAFGEIKGTLEARPMFHWTDPRIEGHMMICFLAYYLEAYITRQLRKAGAEFSAPAAIDALNEIKAVPVKVRGKIVWVKTRVHGIAAKTFEALQLRVPSDILKLPPGSV